MYNTFFGLREKPFKLVPNPEYLFLSKSHEIALAHLTYAIDQGEGFAVITGEVGTGKTTLCRKYLEGLDDQTESAYIFNPRVESEQLLRAICYEFGINTKDAGTNFLDLLNDYLIQKNAEHRKVVLLIDEAQGLSTENLELVRMLSNLETTRSKLLQIVLVGQPELEDKLESHELRQLAQRISLSYRLVPLSAKDTHAYIQHRLWISAQRQTDLFSPDACRLAFRFSKGIPRLINIVCDRALLTAYSHNRPKVTKSVMHAAIMEIIHRGNIATPYKRWFLYLGAGVCLLAMVLVAAIFITRTDFNNKLNIMGYFPSSADTQSPTTPAQKTFKVPGSQILAAGTTTSSSESNLPSDPPGTTEEGPDAPITPDHQTDGQPQAGSEAAPPSDYPVSHSDPGTQARAGQTGIDELVNRLEHEDSRKRAVTTMLAIWQQPRPNADMIPSGVDDADFFEIAARQYGLRTYAAQDNWTLVRRLNLPAIVALNQGRSINPVYLVLVGWHDQFLSFEDPQSGASIDSEFADIQPLLEGSVYIFWKNVFGYDMIIGYGADTRAISGVKAVLRQIGYNQISPSSDFDLSTRAAVKDFQARHYLSPDGLVGPLTKIMLLQSAGTFNVPTLWSKNRPQS